MKLKTVKILAIIQLSLMVVIALGITAYIFLEGPI